MAQVNDMNALVGRTEQLVTAIANAILSSTEVAAQRIELAAEVAGIQQRLSAFGAVVDAIAAQKRALVERRATADGPAKALLERQIELLSLQELAVLERAGVPQVTAQRALTVADAAPAMAPAMPPVGDTDKRYRREGKRFVRVVAGTGTSRNGSPTGGTGGNKGPTM